MKKFLVVLITLALLTGMFSFAAFADSGNGSVQNTNAQKLKSTEDKDEGHVEGTHMGTVSPSGITPKKIKTPSMESIAKLEINLMKHEADLDHSYGNSEDNADHVSERYIKALGTGFFAELKALREEARASWKLIDAKNNEIKKAFSKFQKSLHGLPDAAAKMVAMRAALAPIHARIVIIQADIKVLRADKEKLWAELRLATHNKPISSTVVTPILTKILGLKHSIILRQADLIIEKNAILVQLKAIVVGKIQLTVPTVLTQTKVYDGTTTAVVVVSSAGVSGVIAPDVIVTASAIATYNSPSVGTHKTITIVYSVDGVVSGGAFTAKYYAPDSHKNGTITAKQLTISGTAISVISPSSPSGITKAAVTAGALIGVVSGDSVTVHAHAKYIPGSPNTVSVVYSLGGRSSHNYIKPASEIITVP